MKKIISTVAAFGLVLGAAATASALDLTVTGKYTLEGYYMDQANGATGSKSAGGFMPQYEDDNAGSMSAWIHTFLMKPTLKVNDKIKMISEVRFLKDTEMGDSANQGGTSMGVGDREVDIHKIYMEWMSPYGKVRAGRTPAGSWANDFLSSATSADRVMWWPNMVSKPFSLYFFTQKSVENDWYTSNDDSDKDVYKTSLTYKADNMLLMGAYNFVNNKTDETADQQYSLIELYANMDFDNIYVEFEGGYATGDWKDFDGATPDQDVDAFGAMLDVGMKMGDLDVGVMYYYGSGDDDGTADGDVDNIMAVKGGMGKDFNPYYILNGDHTGMLNNDEYAANADMKAGGVHCIGIHSDYKVSDQLSLHGALAYAMSAEDLPLASDPSQDVDDEYGWEVDLGAKYKLLDNLTYEARAAYFAAGDFFDDTGDYGESEDLYMLSHHLTMTF